MPTNNDVEQKTIWPSNDGFALDDTHYVPSDELSNDNELSIDELNDIDDFLTDNYEEGDLGPSHDDAEYGLNDGELDSINDALEADEGLAYEDVITLPKDTVLMRYVDANKTTDTGEFLTQPGTSKEQLALDPSRDYQAHYYKLDSDLDVHAGTARSWFGEEGGGVQYKLTDNERVNTLQGLDENGNPVEGGKSVITECDEHGEPIDKSEHTDKSAKDTTPFYEKEGFQKVITFATAAVGLATAAINAKDMPNKIDMNDAINDRPSISITIDNKNINSDDISEMLEDMGYSLDDNEQQDINEYSLDDALIDAGQAIDDLGSDEDNLYEMLKDEHNPDDEEMDILNSEIDSLYGDNPDEQEDNTTDELDGLDGDNLSEQEDIATDELDGLDSDNPDEQEDIATDELDDLGYGTDEPEIIDTLNEHEDIDNDRNIM